MKKLALAIFLSLSLGVAHAAYEPKAFDVKMNYVASNPNRGEDGRNFFLNFVQSVQKQVTRIRAALGGNPVGTPAGSIGGSSGGGSGGSFSGGVCR
jgi:hypothetical protein